MSGPPPVARWVFLVLLLAALLIQITLIPRLAPAGVRPDLLVVVVLVIGLFNGIELDVFLFAAVAGLMIDFLAGHLLGLNVLIMVGAVIALQRVTMALTRSNVLVLVGTVAGVNFLSELLRALAVFLAGIRLGPVPVILLMAFTSAAYTGAVAALVYYVMGTYIALQEPMWGWERGARR